MFNMDQGGGASSSSSWTSSINFSTSRPAELVKPASDWGLGPLPEEKTSSPVAYNMVSNSPGFSYSRFGNDAGPSSPEIGWDHGDFESKEERPYMIRWKSGKKVDQRLLMLLESFYQDIYVKREDFFKKIFPAAQEEFTGVFRKIDAMLSRNSRKMKNHTLQRSLSVGSPRRPQRFKVKTPAVVISNPDGQGDATTDSRSTKQ